MRTERSDLRLPWLTSPGNNSTPTTSRNLICTNEIQKDETKRTAAGIPTWSPTVVLICRSTAYVWQSGRDAQFSADCG
ncbi:hypothetical protein KCU95_g12982, partial [Aureobasidium melanogenum]